MILIDKNTLIYIINESFSDDFKSSEAYKSSIQLLTKKLDDIDNSYEVIKWNPLTEDKRPVNTDPVLLHHIILYCTKVGDKTVNEGCMNWVDLAYYEDGEWYIINGIKENEKPDYPIAWAELPEPYKDSEVIGKLILEKIQDNLSKYKIPTEHQSTASIQLEKPIII